MRFKSLIISVLLVMCVMSITLAQNIDAKENSNEQVVGNLKKCLEHKIKYPFFMQFFKLEGRVFVLLSIDVNGKVKDIKVESDYFGKKYSLERFTNKNKIERIRKKIEAQILPFFKDCSSACVFPFPDKIDNSIISLPVSFGTYDDFDDYGISDDYDDYDYNEAYDYNYYEYD